MVSKSPGRNASEPTGGLEKQNPKVESPVAGRRQYGSSQLTDAARSFGGVIGTARRQGHAKQLEKPSSPRREIGGGRKPYNRRHREVGGRREGLGRVRSSEEPE